MMFAEMVMVFALFFLLPYAVSIVAFILMFPFVAIYAWLHPEWKITQKWGF